MIRCLLLLCSLAIAPAHTSTSTSTSSSSTAIAALHTAQTVVRSLDEEENTIHCPNQFTAVGDTCYYLSERNVYMNVANKTCLGMNAWLVAIDSDEENSRLYAWLLQNYDWPEWFLGPYIGLYRYDLDNLDFIWMNPADRGSTYQNWEGGGPSVVVGTDNCVVMTNIDGTWYNYYCDASLQFVCETYPVTSSPTHHPIFAPTVRPTKKPTISPTNYPTLEVIPSVNPTPFPTLFPTTFPSPAQTILENHHPTHSPTVFNSKSETFECPLGYQSIHSTCYSFYSTPSTWLAANESCLSQGGWLVTIESEIEDEALLLWLQSQSGLSRDSKNDAGPFIGLIRDQSSSDYTSQSFHWIQHPSTSSSSSQNEEYSQWSLNYPFFDSSTPQENCAVISLESGWMNVACDTPHQYVCEANRIVHYTSGLTNEANVNSSSSELLFWSLFIPAVVIVGGLLFFFCSKFKKSLRGSSRLSSNQYIPSDDDSENIASTHSLVQNHQLGSSDRDLSGKYQSKYNYHGDSSPEETMEIQLQMRSYAPLTQNSV